MVGQRATDVACGPCHCVIASVLGEVWAWGDGARGQLGRPPEMFKVCVILSIKEKQKIIFFFVYSSGLPHLDKFSHFAAKYQKYIVALDVLL